MKVSIIIPVYNKIKYLNTLLQQVYEQSFLDYECLIVDDGSTDGSEDVCDSFATIDERFRVIHIQNGGVSRARNIGLENARGEFITFIDSDDQISPNYLENLVTCIESSEADLVISGYQKFWDSDSKVICINYSYGEGKRPLKECLSTFATVQRDTGLFGCCVSKIFRRECVQDIRFDQNLCLAEDFDFYLQLYRSIGTVYFDKQCLYRYRQVAENSSSIIDDEKIDYFGQLKLNLRYREFMRNMNAYSGDNEAIIEKVLSNYLYFSAFYCVEEKMKDQLAVLAQLQQKERIKTISGNLMQWLVLTLLGNGRCNLAKNIIISYRRTRLLLKRISIG